MKTFSFAYKKHGGFSENLMQTTAKKLDIYRKHLHKIARMGGYDEPDSAINTAFDRTVFEEARAAAKRFSNKHLRYVFLCGIGGSSMGTQAIYEAVYGQLNNYGNTYPKLIFLDTISGNVLTVAADLVKNIKRSDEFVLLFISKSGKTTETLVNFEFLYSRVYKKFGRKALERVMIITDVGSKLWMEANERGFERLGIPEHVGGRYSIFTTVGLFPLMLARIDVSELLKGAKQMRAQCLETSLQKNHAIASAVALFLHWKNGIDIHNLFCFNPELESLGKWYRQLIAESVGKEYNLSGKKVCVGITPMVSVGSTDLHSLAQLFFAGPRHTFTTFLLAPSTTSKKVLSLPKNLVFPSMVENIAGNSSDAIFEAIYHGVVATYKKLKLPYLEVALAKINAYTLGQFLQMKMMEVMYLAQLMNVNAFDQPNVELYKKQTRQILQKQR
mgnify:CR=1 FL=1